MHGCCDRASQEELVLLDARHEMKAAHAEPGPEVVETRSLPIAPHPAVRPEETSLFPHGLLPTWRPDL